MKSRLESISDGLVKNLVASNNLQRRRAVILACEHALRSASLFGPAYDEHIQDLLRGNNFPPGTLSQLNKIVEELDEKYFLAQETSEDNSETDGDYIIFFSQARAVSSLAFAGEEDSLFFSCESIYEALMAVENRDLLVESILLALTKN
ncbi:hypothetical protein ABQ179_001780 [Xanthomonas dyei]|uniref:hypothetical protein n=1 Tax=Xanthomonas dyei TaxID=743699 RepID=UPI0032E8E2AB